MAGIKTEIMWGVIFIVALLVWMILERLAGLHDTHIDKHLIYTNFFAIPAIAVYVFALRDKRKKAYDGRMTYLQGVKSGALVTVVVAVLSPPAQWITSTIITPDYFANAIEYSVASGFHDSREAAESYFNLQNYLVQSVVGALIMGLVTTLIVAIFLRAR